MRRLTERLRAIGQPRNMRFPSRHADGRGSDRKLSSRGGGVFGCALGIGRQGPRGGSWPLLQVRLRQTLKALRVCLLKRDEIDPVAGGARIGPRGARPASMALGRSHGHADRQGGAAP